MQSASRILLKGALLGALGGPTIGAILLAAAGTLSDLGRPHGQSDSRITEFLLRVAFYWPYGIFLLGPVAAAFGAVGTSIQIQLCRRGLSTRALVAYGVSTGVVLGILCPAVSTLVLSLVYSRDVRDVTETVSRLVDPRNPYTLLGALVGGILGFLTTILVRRSGDATRSGFTVT